MKGQGLRVKNNHNEVKEVVSLNFSVSTTGREREYLKRKV